MAAATAGLLTAVAFALTVGAPWPGPAGSSRPAGPPVQAGPASPSVAPRSGSDTGPPAYAGAGHDRWTRVLQQLDRRRAHAFAAGDAAALSTVYEPGSAVLARDRAVLAAYAGRGLVVHGATLRLLDLRAHRVGAGTVVLRVVDRMRTATARTGDRAAVVLPRDRPTVHRLVLHRGPRRLADRRGGRAVRVTRGRRAVTRVSAGRRGAGCW